MIENTLKLARAAVQDMAAYQSARSHGISASVYLDANESPWHPVTGEESNTGLNRYPSPQPRALMEALSSLYQVGADSLTIGRGADEAIDLLVRAFCEAGRDEIIICPPTYGMYEVAANLQGAGVAKVPAPLSQDFTIDIDAIENRVTEKSKLVFVCSPNNPTGNVTPIATLERLADILLGRAVLVIDEAYIEFASTPSFASRLPFHANVVILRTLSKAWGMAGARCGAALAHPEITKILQKIRAPYPISEPSLLAVLRSLTQHDSIAKLTNQIKEARDALAKALASSPTIKRVFPSESNFLLVETFDAREFTECCLAAGILVRDRSTDYSLRNCVRITLGSGRENELLISALRSQTS